MKENKLYRLIEVFMAVFVLGILFILIVIDNRFSYVYQNFCIVPNWMLVSIILALLCGYAYLKGRKRKQKKEDCDDIHNMPAVNKLQIKLERRNLILMSVVLYGIQLIVAWQIYFKTGWDCGILVEMAQEVAFHYNDIGDNHYFSMYPNNILLVGIFAAVLRFVKFLGFHADYFPLIMIGCLLVNMAGFFMADSIRKLTSKHGLALAAWFLYVFLAGLSPWISIPYSDTYSILFPILCIWLYVNKTEKNKYLNWGCIGFFAWIGQYIKPTVLLVFMVLVALELWHFLCTIKREEWKSGVRKVVSLCAVLGMAILLASGVNGLARVKMGCELDENKRFTPWHYLMMGLNYTTGGTYDQGDVNFSAGAPDVAARNAQAFERIGERVSEMGVKGVCLHFGRKVLTNFNDGTFAWGNEGEFYWNIQEKQNGLSKALRSYYYEGGANFDVFQLATQAAWILTLCMLPCFFLKRKEEIGQHRAAICLSILAICCFVMVFEARARYLFLYSPVFILAATLGMERVLESLEVRLGKNNVKKRES